MTVHFHPAAINALDAAVQYYEDRQPGLGLRFAEEVYAAVARIAQHPRAWPQVSNRTRRCLVGRFPYGVIDQPAQDTLRVIAVASLHRRPGYWKDRVGVAGRSLTWPPRPAEGRRGQASGPARRPAAAIAAAGRR